MPQPDYVQVDAADLESVAGVTVNEWEGFLGEPELAGGPRSVAGMTGLLYEPYVAKGRTLVARITIRGDGTPETGRETFHDRVAALRTLLGPVGGQVTLTMHVKGTTERVTTGACCYLGGLDAVTIRESEQVAKPSLRWLLLAGYWDDEIVP